MPIISYNLLVAHNKTTTSVAKQTPNTAPKTISNIIKSNYQKLA